VDQSQDGEVDRPDYSAECAGKSGQGHKMTFAIFGFVGRLLSTMLSALGLLVE
jgi:hypothetical protein